jgi:hypothetical protein
MLKMAALPAMPSASIPMTIKLNAGFSRMARKAIFRSCPKPERNSYETGGVK